MFGDITASWLRKQVGDEQQSTAGVERRCAEAKKKYGVNAKNEAG